MHLSIKPHLLPPLSRRFWFQVHTYKHTFIFVFSSIFATNCRLSHTHFPHSKNFGLKYVLTQRMLLIFLSLCSWQYCNYTEIAVISKNLRRFTLQFIEQQLIKIRPMDNFVDLFVFSSLPYPFSPLIILTVSNHK